MLETPKVLGTYSENPKNITMDNQQETKRL
jgi:hypothetical protein